MEWYNSLNLGLSFLCGPADLIFAWIFGFVPPMLKTLCVSMLILTIGKILGFYERKTYAIVKLMLYGWFFLYTLYTLDFLTDMGSYDPLDWSSLLFGILAPLCLIIVGIIIKNRFKEMFKFDLYYLLMVLYLILGGFWYVLRPKQINFSLYAFYWAVLLGNVYLFSQINKGVLSMGSSEKYNFWKNLKVVSKIILIIVIYHIVFVFVIPLNPETLIQNWTIGIIGVISFSLLSMMFYYHRQKYILIWGIFFSLTWLLIDAKDFILFLVTPAGIIILLISFTCIMLLILYYQEKTLYLGEALIITIVYCIIFCFLFRLNDETIVENWALGLFFTFIFVILYLLPPGKLWLIIKRFHVFMIAFWLCWFLADYQDFISTIIQIYGF